MTLLAAVLAAVAAWLSLTPAPVPPPRTPAPGAWWPLAAAAIVGVLLVAGPLVVPVLLVGWGGRALLRVRARRREAVATADRVLEACEQLAADVAAGQPPARALVGAAGAWPALRPAAAASTLGGDVPMALRELAVRPGAGELRLVAAAWAVAHRTGSGLAEALDRVAATIRADRATGRVVAGELASARATARLVAALPVLVLMLGSGTGAGGWRFLVGTPVGLACLVAGLALGLLGLWWIERIADGVAR
jgi:tight adherence protein B